VCLSLPSSGGGGGGRSRIRLRCCAKGAPGTARLGRIFCATPGSQTWRWPCTGPTLTAGRCSARTRTLKEPSPTVHASIRNDTSITPRLATEYTKTPVHVVGDGKQKNGWGEIVAGSAAFSCATGLLHLSRHTSGFSPRLHKHDPASATPAAEGERAINPRIAYAKIIARSIAAAGLEPIATLFVIP